MPLGGSAVGVAILMVSESPSWSLFPFLEEKHLLNSQINLWSSPIESKSPSNFLPSIPLSLPPLVQTGNVNYHHWLALISLYSWILQRWLTKSMRHTWDLFIKLLIFINGCSAKPWVFSSEHNFSFFVIWMGWGFSKSSGSGSYLLNNSSFNSSLLLHFAKMSQEKPSCSFDI